MDNPLNVLLRSLDLETLVPPAHARFEPLVRDGFEYFLHALNPARRREIISQQLSLPANAGTPTRLARLLKSCPTLHKLGQLLARDQRLPATTRRSLKRLESGPPGADFERVKQMIRSEIGDITELKLADRALAEASVATVVPFSWRSSGSATTSGVFKVLKPDVEEQLAEELEIWTGLALHLEARSAHHGLPTMDYQELIAAATGHLHQEVDLERERERLQWAANFYADSPGVLISQLFPIGSARVSAMERVYGSKITDARTSVPGGPWRITTLLVNELLARPFFSDQPTAYLHADPHPGNVLLTTDGRIAILDWCQVAELSTEQRRAVVQLVLGSLSLDEDRVCRAMVPLTRGPILKSAMRRCVQDAIGAVSKGTIPGIRWLLALFDELLMSRALTFSDDLLLLRKSVHNLDGVANHLYPGFPLDSPLIECAGKQLMRELPGWLMSLNPALRFAGPVSNSDLFAFWTTMPVTANRAWLYYTRQMLGND